MKLTKVEINTRSNEELDETIDNITDSLNYFMETHPGFSVVIDKYLDSNTAFVKICQLNEQVN